MNNLVEVKEFNHEMFGGLRVAKDDNNETWFVAKDVTDVLELSNTTVALQSLEDFERTKLNLGRQGETNCISESGMYALIMKSRKPQARQFRIWVTSEVLPSIRKNGGYITNQENLSPAEIVANALVVANNIIIEKEQRLKEAHEIIEIQAPKVEAWERLMDSGKSIDFAELSKAFAIKGLGRNNFMKLLREKKVLRPNNEPYQSYIDSKYFEIILIENAFSPTKTLVSPKGVDWLAKKLKEWNYLV